MNNMNDGPAWGLNTRPLKLQVYLTYHIAHVSVHYTEQHDFMRTPSYIPSYIICLVQYLVNYMQFFHFGIMCSADIICSQLL